MKLYFSFILILLIWINKVQMIKANTSSIICGSIRDLTPAQRKICSRVPDATIALSTGYHMGAEECNHQFQGYRWNCTHVWKENYFNHVISIGTRETAYTYAITSAGAVYAIAEACAKGKISSCGCDHPERHLSSEYKNYRIYAPHGFATDDQPYTEYAFNNTDYIDADQPWTWGGCSHDVGFGMRFAKKFFDAREVDNDARTLMNLHNNKVGRKIVKNRLKVECRCRYGACGVKTCWKELPSFREIGDAIMQRYHNARQVRAVIDKKTNKLTLVIHRLENYRVGLPPKTMDLVFLNSSPTFCDINLEYDSHGTHGRKCNHTLLDVGSCNLICCGRGYNTKIIYSTFKCNCKFVWCCSVKCDVCHRLREESYCK
ncbi:protein Wnt-2 isoform X3 [Condylostylus longicornis]|uniref:protein Wnt-2 isoform X3 n=1 Tax=Condylostylus longicornis TaxID=2530218 RepID=UPI00244DEC06|nr:protein Wnt-2 isoform X3 [Condylostylus longicornis]